MSGKSSCAGVIFRISPILTFALGQRVFVEILCEGDDDAPDQVVFLCLTGTAINERSSLELGRFYSFTRVQRCSWTTESDVGDARTVHSRQLWYQTVHDTTMTCDTGKVSQLFDLKSLSNNADILQSILFPRDTYTRELRAVQEVSVEGKVTKLHQLGCLEVEMSNRTSSRLIKVYLFVAHYRGLDRQAAICKGSSVYASFVLPVYLWNECVGFAATMRSTIVFNDEASAGVAGDEHRNILANVATGSFKTAPDEVRKRCHMYASWRLYLDRRLGGDVLAGEAPVTVYRDIIDFLQNRLDVNFVSETTGAYDRFDVTRPPTHIAQVTRVDESRNVQTEFTDALYSQLYSVRAGHDAEWLSSKLIKLCSCEDIVRLGVQLCDADCGRSKSIAEDATWQVDGVEWLCRLYDLSTLALCCRGKGVVGKVEAVRSALDAKCVPALPQNTAFIGTLLVGPTRQHDEDLGDCDDDGGGMAAFCRVCDGLGNVVNVIIRDYYPSSPPPPHPYDASSSAISSAGDFKGVLIVHNPKLLLEISPLPGAVSGPVTVVGEARRTQVLYGVAPQQQQPAAGQAVASNRENSNNVSNSKEGADREDASQGCCPGARHNDASVMEKKRQLPADFISCGDSRGSSRRTCDVLSRALLAAQIVSGGEISRAPFDRENIDKHESFSASALHVRQLLTAPRRKPDGVFSGRRIASLVGVVVYKGLLADDKQQQQPKGPRGSKGSSNAPRRCTLVLRDLAHADIIKAYLPAALARAAVVGLRVVLRNAVIHVTENLRSVYLKNSDQLGTCIGKCTGGT